MHGEHDAERVARAPSGHGLTCALLMERDEKRRAAAVHPIAALQTEYSLWTRDVEEQILPTALLEQMRAHRLSVMSIQEHHELAMQGGGGQALETVEDGQTGVFFSEPTVESLMAALQRASRTRFEPARARARAEQFSRAQCLRHLRQVIEETAAAPTGTQW